MDVLPPFFFDCETIPAGEMPAVTYPRKPTRDDVKVGNRNKEKAEEYRDEKLPDLILLWEDECKKLDIKNEEEFKKRATNSLTAELVCIAYATGDAEPEVITGTEKEIVGEFMKILNSYGQRQISLPLIGHNIMEFDIPLLFHRAIKFQYMSLVNYFIGLNNYQGREMIFDTMREWNIFSYKKYTKLDDIAQFLGIPGKGDIDGSKVWDMWRAGKQQQVYDYCCDDVILLRNIYKRMKTLTT